MYIMYYTLFLTLTVLRSSEDKGFDEFLFPENVNDLGQEIAMAAQRICPGCLCLEGAVASSTVRLHPGSEELWALRWLGMLSASCEITWLTLHFRRISALLTFVQVSGHQCSGVFYSQHPTCSRTRCKCYLGRLAIRGSGARRKVPWPSDIKWWLAAACSGLQRSMMVLDIPWHCCDFRSEFDSQVSQLFTCRTSRTSALGRRPN